jgi:hypothetical protein
MRKEKEIKRAAIIMMKFLKKKVAQQQTQGMFVSMNIIYTCDECVCVCINGSK